MKKCVRVAAQREDVMKAIKTLDNDRVLLSGSAFGEDSFSFKMRTKTHNRMYGSVRVSGRVKQEGAECVVAYSVRVGSVSIIAILPFLLTFVWCLVASPFTSVPREWLFISGGVTVTVGLIVLGDIQICDARIKRKLRALETAPRKGVPHE